MGVVLNQKHGDELYLIRTLLPPSRLYIKPGFIKQLLCGNGQS